MTAADGPVGSAARGAGVCDGDSKTIFSGGDLVTDGVRVGVDVNVIAEVAVDVSVAAGV